MFAYLFLLQLLWLVQDSALLAADFKLATELVSVHDLIVEEELASGAMLDPHLCVSLHWLAQ